METMILAINYMLELVFYDHLWSGSDEWEHAEAANEYAWFLHDNDTIIIEFENLRFSDDGGLYINHEHAYIAVLGMNWGYYTNGFKKPVKVTYGQESNMWHVITKMDGALMCRLDQEDWDDTSMIIDYTDGVLAGHYGMFGVCVDCRIACRKADEESMRYDNTPRNTDNDNGRF